MGQGSEWLSRKEAAAYLTSLGYRMSYRTLERLAHKSPPAGPPYDRFGWKTVSYKREDLVRWLETQREHVGAAQAA